MIFELDPKEVEAIADKVFTRLKPLLTGSSELIGRNTSNDPAHFSVKGLAEYLTVDPSWIYQKVRDQKIPYIKMGKYTKFRKSEIDLWLENKSIKPLF
jgi:excisionase family DNA binding protein